MSKKKTIDDFFKDSSLLQSGEYALTENSFYHNNKTGLNLFHHGCQKEITVIPRHFLKGRGCIECNKKLRIAAKRKETGQKIQQQISEVDQGTYEVVDITEFTGMKKPLRIKHKVCKNISSPTPYDFIRSSRCPSCFHESQKTTHDDFLKKLNELGNNEYAFAEGTTFQNDKTPVSLIHIPCGTLLNVLPKTFKRGSRCKPCQEVQKRAKKIAETEKKLETIKNGEYELISTLSYRGNNIISLIHKPCGKSLRTTLAKFSNDKKPHNCNGTRKAPVKRTLEIFQKEVEIHGSGEYSVVPGEVYRGSGRKIKLLHHVCNKPNGVTPSNFLKNRRCPHCQRKKSNPKRKTHVHFLKEVKAAVGNEYTVLSTYQESTQKVTMKHNASCNHEWDIIPSSFLSGVRCPPCDVERRSKLRTRSLESFLKEMKEKFGDEYAYREGQSFKNRRTPVLITHRTCGEEFPIRPSNLLNFRGCPPCRNAAAVIKRRKDFKTLNKQVEAIGDYSILAGQTYINTDTHMTFRHDTCGYSWDIIPSSFLIGTRCPECNGGTSKSHESFMEEFNAVSKGDYTLVNGERYQSHNRHIQVKHSCGFEYPITPSSFLRGTRCTVCFHTSKGEDTIADFLKEHAYKFISQKTFPDCVYKRELRFDFAIYQEDNILAMVEYNGIQHYEPIEFFGGQESLRKTQLRDEIKRAYCQKKNYPLIIIKYDEDIIKKLSEELHKLEVKQGEELVFV